MKELGKEVRIGKPYWESLYSLHIAASMLALGQHQCLIEQLDLNDGWFDATCLAVHLHGNGAFGNDASLATLTDAGTVHARLQHGQLVGGQSDHLHETIVDGWLGLAKGIVPGVCAAAIAAKGDSRP